MVAGNESGVPSPETVHLEAGRVKPTSPVPHSRPDHGPRCLCLAGLNVVLVSRTKAKLDAAASEIAAATGVQTKVVVADFSSADQGTWEGLREAIAPLDVGILVNNVGLSYDHAEFFDAIDDTLIDDLVQVNIQATNKVCFCGGGGGVPKCTCVIVSKSLVRW